MVIVEGREEPLDDETCMNNWERHLKNDFSWHHRLCFSFLVHPDRSDKVRDFPIALSRVAGVTIDTFPQLTAYRLNKSIPMICIPSSFPMIMLSSVSPILNKITSFSSFQNESD